jgi:hypothetical protein|tara:strand:+ start:180 stop:2561 length:2382 start_codon:yes stop_codon:yes gene_type:complete
MSSKKVTIVNVGLLKSDTDSDNKDLFREEFGSWYSKTNGFKFIKKENKDLSFEVTTDTSVSLSSVASFYKFRQELLFSQDFSMNPSMTGLQVDFDTAEDQKETLHNRISSYISSNQEYEDFSVEMLLPISKEETYNVRKSRNISGYSGVDFMYNYTDKSYERALSNPAVTELVVPSMYGQVTMLKNKDTEESTLKSVTKNTIDRNLNIARSRSKYKRQMVIGDPLKTIGSYEDNKYLFPFHAEIQVPLSHNSEISEAIQESTLGAVLMRDFSENLGTNSLESMQDESLYYSVDMFPANGGNKTSNFTVNFKTMNLNDWWSYDLPAWADTSPPKLPNTSMFISDENTFQQDLASRGTDSEDIWNNAWIATLAIPTLQGKLSNIMQSHARTFDQVLGGETSYSESLFYKIQKFKGRKAFGAPIQEFYLYNSTDVDAVISDHRKMSFIDTQLKTDTAYTYVVSEFRAVVGTKYAYDPSSLSPVEDMYLGENAKLYGSVMVEVEPVVKIIEVPLFTSTGRVLAPPPMPPDVDVISYKGVSNRLMFFFKSHIGQKLEEPISFSADQDLDNRQFLLHEKTSNEGEILFSTVEGISFVEVYRMQKKPENIMEFSENLLETISTDADTITDMTASSVGKIIKQSPNKKFYYMFRASGMRGESSNPSPVYEIELYNDGGASYPIVKIIDLEKPNHRTKTKSFRNLLRITPKISQSAVNELQSGLISEDGTLGNAIAQNITLGLEDEPLFGKKFKIRLTSKKTGKKIDLNIDFKTATLKTGAESAAGPIASGHVEGIPKSPWE